MNSATVKLFSISVLCLKITKFHLPKPFFLSHSATQNQPNGWKTIQSGNMKNTGVKYKVCNSELLFSLSSGPSMSFNVALTSCVV